MYGAPLQVLSSDCLMPMQLSEPKEACHLYMPPLQVSYQGLLELLHKPRLSMPCQDGCSVRIKVVRWC